MNYQELKNKHQQEANAAPIIFAFSNEQLAEGLKKLNATVEEICSLGAGAYMRKSDVQDFLDMRGRQQQEMKQALENSDFMIAAITYELNNHEYCITLDPDDALEAIGISQDSDQVIQCLKIATTQYLKTNPF